MVIDKLARFRGGKYGRSAVKHKQQSSFVPQN